MAEIAELEKGITSPQSFLIKRLTEPQTQIDKQAEIISKQKRFLEKEANVILLGMPGGALMGHSLLLANLAGFGNRRTWAMFAPHSSGMAEKLTEGTVGTFFCYSRSKTKQVHARILCGIPVTRDS